MAQKEAERLARIERQIRALEREKKELVPKVRAPPVFPIPKKGIEKFRGASYSTWFKALGSFGPGRNWDSYAAMQNLLDEDLMDIEAPAAFYSQQITGRVKWPGIVDREVLIQDLNDKAPWDGDFRDIYPRWEYEYRVVESIGGVPVRFYVHKGKQPPNKARGIHGY